MIDFTTQQLTYILVGALGIGGTGYMALSKDIEEVKVKMAITHTNTENTMKSLDQLQTQLNRIEEKIDNKNNKR
jgi:predicted nuclease with TOPRIM domain